MEKKIVYFEDISPDNTEITFALVKETLKATGIKKIVLASTTGATASKAADQCSQVKQSSTIRLLIVMEF